MRFLNRALLPPEDSEEYGSMSSIKEVEEAKAFLRLVPIWITNLVYALVFAQSSTFFTKQGATMDRWDCITRALTGKPAGITMLQRIGSGMFLSILTMVIAALVEMKRLKTAEEYGLIDKPNVTIPMSVCWLIPQYVVTGVSEALTMVGLQEFFYDQVPC
ncbi:hypothetical protein Patl1_07385 [Pistacia atlantica]|uniref:Uncharacterized protein n=1 Tax=Pistacia atlantica TaxID=434234 RepID=A0ACC1AFR2_9ROSI|nr:hypothetical protein Patl1_07385 [Pistacia atlantica]